MNVAQPVLIFAVNLDNTTQDKGFIESYLGEYKPKELIGYWDGKMEASYLVDAQYLDKVQQMARARDQESVLYLDSNRLAFLLTQETDYDIEQATYIGTFMQTSEHVARRQQGWTLDPTTWQYYTIF